MRSIALVIVLALSSLASAQDSNRLNAYLALGAGGEVTFDPDGSPSSDADLDATVGLGVRYEIVLGKLFSIAPMFEWLTYELDALGANREHIVNFDVFLKFRGVVRAGSTDLELYGGIPIGFTLATVDAGIVGNDDPLLGFNLGVLGGIAAFFGDYGVFFEVGWRGHQVWRDDVRYGANQAGIHIGGAIKL